LEELWLKYFRQKGNEDMKEEPSGDRSLKIMHPIWRKTGKGEKTTLLNHLGHDKR